MFGKIPFTKKPVAEAAHAEVAMHPELKKQEGFSLPGMLVASVLAAILGAVAISNMWPSVDRTRVSAEYSTIQNLKESMAGLMEESQGMPTALATAQDDALKARVGSISSDFKYQALLIQNATTGTGDDVLAVKAYAATAEQANQLKAIATELEKRIDNTASPAASDNAGDFQYDTTCTAPDATDCYYIVKGYTKSSSAPADLTAAVLGTAAGGIAAGGNTTDATVVDNVADLN